MITPVSFASIGYNTYIYFSVFNFCFIPLIYFLYPETRKLSLEQIDKLFTGEKVMLHWKESMGEIRGEVEGGSAGARTGLEEEKGHVQELEAGRP